MPEKSKEKMRFYQKRWYRKHINRLRKENAKWRRDFRKANPKLSKIIDRKARSKKTNQQKAMNKVSWAIESGKLNKPFYCYCCGNKKPLQGHHYDYSKPLDIIWLCSACHKFLHCQIKIIAEMRRAIEEG